MASLVEESVELVAKTASSLVETSIAAETSSSAAQTASSASVIGKATATKVTSSVKRTTSTSVLSPASEDVLPQQLVGYGNTFFFIRHLIFETSLGVLKFWPK